MAAPAPAGRGLLGTVMEGMAFGTGSAIAHRAVGAIAGSFGGASAAAGNGQQPEQQQPESNTVVSRGQDCSPFQLDFTQCLKQNKNDIAQCQMYLDNLTQCQQDNRLI